jgi:hypothetical protein
MVPNAFISNQLTVNLVSVDPQVTARLTLPNSHDSEVDKARSALIELARKHEVLPAVAGCPVTLPHRPVITLTLKSLVGRSECGLRASRRFERADSRPLPRTEIPYLFTEVNLHRESGPNPGT